MARKVGFEPTHRSTQSTPLAGEPKFSKIRHFKARVGNGVGNGNKKRAVIYRSFLIAF